MDKKLKQTSKSTERRRRSRVLVAGLGNYLLRDDGVGIHAVRRFKQIRQRHWLAVELGTAVFDWLHLIEKADRILAFDALEAGGNPGSVYLIRGEDAGNEIRYTSMHEMGLIKALQTLRRPAPEVLVIGAEPQIIDWGTELSPVVDSAVESMISTAGKVLEYWQNHSARFEIGSLSEVDSIE